MAKGIPARLTAAQGRRFGLTVGAAFLLLAGVAWWRDNPALTGALATLGGTLSLAGLLIPTYLGPVERNWMKLAHLLSKVTTPIVMGAMYLGVFTPVGLVRRLFGNPLVHTAPNSTYWKSRPAERRAGNLKRQF
jgi:hypothetical protein